MDSDRPSPLPTNLARLIELEQKAYGTDVHLRADVLRRVETVVALRDAAITSGLTEIEPPSPHPVRPRRLQKAAALALLMFAAGAAAGREFTRLVSPSPSEVQVPLVMHPAGVSSVVQRSSAPTPLPPTPVEPPPDLAPSSPAAATSASPPVHAAAASSPTNNGDLVKERELLDVARAALGRSRPAEALDVALEHEKKWPRGLLVEEREVVLVQALMALGRRQDAQATAVRFRTRFPQSMLMPAVDLALEGGTP